jgi:triosephosphate isomerase
VPSIHISAAKSLFRPDIAVAAEDVGFNKGYGAFTGEISAEMLVDSGIKWTLTGHSERRVGFGFPVITISFLLDILRGYISCVGRDFRGGGCED